MITRSKVGDVGNLYVRDLTSETKPENPSVNDVLFDIGNGTTAVYDGTDWIVVGDGSGGIL